MEYDRNLRLVMQDKLECAGSSRVHADEILELVLKMLRGEEVEIDPPFAHHRVGKLRSG